MPLPTRGFTFNLKDMDAENPTMKKIHYLMIE